MYRNAYQRGLLTVLFSGGADPLSVWGTYIKDGYINRFLDQDIKGMVIDIGGTNISTTYIECPKGKQVLGISMPFLIMVVKNMKKYFSFEVTIMDDTRTRRRFRVSNFQSTTQILPMCTVMPISLSDGWNQIQFNLSEFTRRAYKRQFAEVQKLKINANIRIRRIYFAERLLPEDELPAAYKLFFPLGTKKKVEKKETVEEAQKDIKLETIKSPSKQGSKVEVGAGLPGTTAPIQVAASRVPSKIGIETAPATIPEGEELTEVTQAEGEDKHTDADTEAPADAETEAGTEIQAESETVAPAETEGVTEGEVPTEAPTEDVAEAETEDAAEAATEDVTEAATESGAPAESEAPVEEKAESLADPPAEEGAVAE